MSHVNYPYFGTTVNPNLGIDAVSIPLGVDVNNFPNPQNTNVVNWPSSYTCFVSNWPNPANVNVTNAALHTIIDSYPAVNQKTYIEYSVPLNLTTTNQIAVNNFPTNQQVSLTTSIPLAISSLPVITIANTYFNANIVNPSLDVAITNPVLITRIDPSSTSSVTLSYITQPIINATTPLPVNVIDSITLAAGYSIIASNIPIIASQVYTEVNNLPTFVDGTVGKVLYTKDINLPVVDFIPKVGDPAIRAVNVNCFLPTANNTLPSIKCLIENFPAATVGHVIVDNIVQQYYLGLIPNPDPLTQGTYPLIPGYLPVFDTRVVLPVKIDDTIPVKVQVTNNNDPSDPMTFKLSDISFGGSSLKPIFAVVTGVVGIVGQVPVTIVPGGNTVSLAPGSFTVPVDLNGNVKIGSAMGGMEIRGGKPYDPINFPFISSVIDYLHPMPVYIANNEALLENRVKVNNTNTEPIPVEITNVTAPQSSILVNNTPANPIPTWTLDFERLSPTIYISGYIKGDNTTVNLPVNNYTDYPWYKITLVSAYWSYAAEDYGLASNVYFEKFSSSNYNRRNPCVKRVANNFEMLYMATGSGQTIPASGGPNHKWYGISIHSLYLSAYAAATTTFYGFTLHPATAPFTPLACWAILEPVDFAMGVAARFDNKMSSPIFTYSTTLTFYCHKLLDDTAYNFWYNTVYYSAFGYVDMGVDIYPNWNNAVNYTLKIEYVK